MASLKETAEVSWRQVFPNPGDDTAITVDEFIVTAKGEYAWMMQLNYWAEKQRDGEAVIPSHVLSEKVMDVVNNEIDISSLNIFRSLSADIWLQNIGGLDCKCRYMKSDVNMSQLLCDDDSKPDNFRTYLTIGNKIKFPNGTHSKSLPIIYANSGDEIDDDIEIDDGIASLIRAKLIEMYSGKTGKEDLKNDTSSSTE